MASSKKGTEFEHEVLLMEVTNVNRFNDHPVTTHDTQYNRKAFSTWFRELNAHGRVQLSWFD